MYMDDGMIFNTASLSIPSYSTVQKFLINLLPIRFVILFLAEDCSTEITTSMDNLFFLNPQKGIMYDKERDDKWRFVE